MNLTTTRAEQTACAEPDFALRRLYNNTTSEPEIRQPSQDVHAHGSPVNAPQSDRQPVQTEDEMFGMVLLGIGYDTSVA